ncbi:MAG: 3-hydroxyacyl-CoA dehydrogenase NAD-binding domain-containing protein [Bacteriovoracales bacterium]|nr:3-hydroxyacyl-CoA dehydrogenase NAD-binding domain-containing protein [Bacteriovoracales bacterium]
MNLSSLSFEIKRGVAHVGFGKDPKTSMPILDRRTLEELEKVVDRVEEDRQKLKGLLLFSHNSRAFLAGADISLIGSMKSESDAAHGAERGQALFNRIEDLPFPTAVCIHGICLGGGCELALSCQKIYLSDDPATRIGLPEVQLGLIPGFGGTYRMPKRVGLLSALDLILTGKKIDAKKAKRISLADETYPKEKLVEMALATMGKRPKKKTFGQISSRWAKGNFFSKKIIFSKARENVLKKTKGHYQAPLKILDVMEDGQGKGRSSYLASEAMAFGELCLGNQGQNLLHIFSLMDGAKKYKGPKPKGPVPSLSQGGVLGAGTMGGGLAWLFAQNGQSPLLKDVSTKALELGLAQSGSNFYGALKRKKISRSRYQKLQRSITPTLSYEGFKSVDLLIEAVPEDMGIKKRILAEAEGFVGEKTIITSNTSSLSITEMAKALKRPEHFAGLHFFNPVHRMPLVEIVTHEALAHETLEALYHWVLAVKKTPIIVKDGPGFLVNRILLPYMSEPIHMMEAGIPPEAIEKACLNFGMPMGPFRLLDEVGLDVGAKVSHILHKALGPRMAVSSLMDEVVASGALGRKSAKGFYHYDERGKQGEWNREVDAFFPSKKSSSSPDETTLQMMIFLPMINEAAYILEEGIVSGAREVDLGLIFGIGFPPFRGGLLRYADYEGLERITKAMEGFSTEIDPYRYTPCPYLKKLVDEKRSFYS